MIATGARGALRELNEAGVLDVADVHVARRLGRLGGEQDEQVLLAAALVVRGTRAGSVVLRLADVATTIETDPPYPWPDPDAWQRALARSPLVGPGRPLHLQDGGLWLTRSHRQEEQVAAALLDRSGELPVDDTALTSALAALWPGTAPDDQRLAAAVCVLNRTAVLVGGPGTGKTTTVARVLHLLHQVGDRPPRVALSAPTGKAAGRLQESVAAAGLLNDPPAATTLHRLLGMRRGTNRAWHDAANPLPHDVVVVDEASMVSLGLFAALLAALRPTARLLLVGDPDQLASVEAGAVLADLVADADGRRTAGLARRLGTVAPHDVLAGTETDTPGARLRSGSARLTTVHRYDAGGAIDDLAEALRRGDAGAAVAVLRRGDPAVTFAEVPDDATVPAEVLRDRVLTQARALHAAAVAGESGSALRALDTHRLLCAHREGPRGVSWWSSTVQRWVVGDLGLLPRPDGRYPGLPLLVTSNDPDNGLYNGDAGVVVERDGVLAAAFARGDVPLSRLSSVVPLHAMTVHRSQGSQFAAVTVLLPPTGSPLLTRQTLYTAVTRAATSVTVVGSEDAVRHAVATPVARATGLRARLR